MYKTFSQYKSEARAALSGKWGIAVCMSIISIGITYAVSELIPLIGTLLSILFEVGILSFSLKLCCGQKDAANFGDVFYGFKCHPGKALLLYLLQVLYLLPGTLIYVVLISVSIVLSGAASGALGLALPADSFAVTGATAVLILLVFLAATVAYIFYSFYITLTYSQIFYILLDYPDLSVTDIWKRSAAIMKGNRMRLFLLNLSFIGWGILAVFTFGIGLLWLMPYITTSQSAFYLDLAQNKGMQSDSTAVPNTPVTPQTSDTETYHACDIEHTDLHEADGNNYTGIDVNSFK